MRPLDRCVRGAGELGRVSRLATTAGSWAVKEIELFVPTVEEADDNVALQESMLDAGVNLPRPRRTIDGHGLLGNVRVYEWLDLTPVLVGDLDMEMLVAASLACMHITRPRRTGLLIPGTARRRAGTNWLELVGMGGHVVGDGGRRARRRADRPGPT